MWKYPMKENFVLYRQKNQRGNAKSAKISWEERTYFGASSGTEPLLRVMVEGENEAEIQELADYVADVIREQLV